MHGHDNPCYISGILTNPFVKDKRFLVLEVQRGHGINDVMAVQAAGHICSRMKPIELRIK